MCTVSVKFHFPAIANSIQLSVAYIPQLYGFIEAAGITGEVGAVVSIERRPQLSLVVVVDYHRQVQVSVVAIVEATPKVVTMQVFRVCRELQMRVFELQSTDAQHHALYYAVSA